MVMTTGDLHRLMKEYPNPTVVPIPVTWFQRFLVWSGLIRPRCSHELHTWELLHGDIINHWGCRYYCRNCWATATPV